VKKLVLLVVLVLASVALAPVSASAAGPVNLHSVNLKNRTIPGSTCHSSQPIKLHNGHGKGGKLGGIQLVDDVYGKATYGDLTHDGNSEAMLFVMCSTGGGTSASDVKDNWVVFTGQSGKVRVLGVMTAKHQWYNTHPTSLDTPKLANGVATVREIVYFPTDPDCCGTGVGSTEWWFHNGALRVKSTTLKITDKIVSSRRVGHAALGMTVARLQNKYGTIQSEELANGGCRVYWHGKQSKSFGALIDSKSAGKVYGIYAPKGAVTVAGIGQYSTVAQINRAYAGHTIKSGTNAAGKQVYVKFANSWFAFTLKKMFGSLSVVSMRIGTRGFVTGAHTCSS
jgi:hypothetical protein